MTRPFITVGDKTSHGGTVISGDQSFLLHGKAVARVGDLTTCPRCKGTFPIANGAGDMTSMGQAPAREGDKTACGATLIASQAVSTHAEESSSGRSASSSAAMDTASAASLTEDAKESGICLSCMVAAAKSGASMIVRE
ncbi:PAAR domain-containing protein [Herbaspirillum sp. YR522]|uniref:PAAR domain-containing protein n=1 Tax=Herbaspirillum sp. YR522 TaxID=1144342 RepID=UPI00026F5CB5|nr:PAAR domain-containing protein [Herbaspirillum sp. YR522]EJN01738.1 hypothetical protein PMI40_03225 [Herbaspirillum sp. YR522]